MPLDQQNTVHLILDNLRSAFNVGSIFRTSDAGKISRIHLCGMTPHPPHDRLSRTALGADEHVPWTYYASTSMAVELLKNRAIPLVGVELTAAAIDYTRFKWVQPVALVMGHEVRGIAPDILAECSEVVKIPMYGVKNSINVATAYGIILYEILRQCPTKREVHPDS
jgi:23S rRNA (guanosine2251-2'-O)-methyltransferase